MKVVFIPSKEKTDMPWGADFFLEAAMAHSEHEIIPHYGFNNLGRGVSESVWENADIIHLHNLAHTALDRARPLGWKSKIKEYTREVPGARPLFIGGIRGYAGLKKGLKFAKYFDAIHVGSYPLAKPVISHNPRIFVAYPGVDIDKFIPADAPGDGILWVGDLDKKVKNAHLLKDLPWPVKVASKQNYIDHDDMPDFYNSGHVLISLSEREGFCRPVIEAMACGLTVISTRTGIAPRVLGERWLIDDPRTRRGWGQLLNKLNFLINDPDRREMAGTINRDKALAFSWWRVIKALDGLWEQVYDDFKGVSD